MAREGQGYPCYQRDMMTMMMMIITTNNNNAQKNSKCGLCGDIDETVNPIISRCDTVTKGIQESGRLSVKGDPLRIMKEIKNWSC